ncbi:MAG TPA: hypothetical protein VGJ94_12830 [Syntrophorhabdaceae bacterium]
MADFDIQFKQADDSFSRGEYRRCVKQCAATMKAFMLEAFFRHFGKNAGKDPVVKEHLLSCGKSSVDYMALAELVDLCRKKGMFPLYVDPVRTVRVDVPDLRRAVKIENGSAQATTADREAKDNARAILEILSRLLNIPAAASRAGADRQNAPGAAGCTAQIETSPSAASGADVRKPRRIIPGARRTETIVRHTKKDFPQETTMVVYRNRQSGRSFLHIEDVGEDQARFVSPYGDIRLLSLNLFEEPEKIEKTSLLSENLITTDQVNAFVETTQTPQGIGTATWYNPTAPAAASPHQSPFIKRMAPNDLVPHVVAVLSKHGGQAKQAQIVEEVFEFFKNIFQEPFYQELTSPGVPKWKYYIIAARKLAEEQDLIEPSPGPGRGWELTPKGAKGPSAKKQRSVGR